MHVYDHFGLVLMHSESWHVLICGSSNGLSHESKWIGGRKKSLKTTRNYCHRFLNDQFQALVPIKLSLWHIMLVGSISDYFVASVYKCFWETLGKKCISNNLSLLLKLIKNNDWDPWAKIICILPLCYDQHPILMPKIKLR